MGGVYSAVGGGDALSGSVDGERLGFDAIEAVLNLLDGALCGGAPVLILDLGGEEDYL